MQQRLRARGDGGRRDDGRSRHGLAVGRHQASATTSRSAPTCASVPASRSPPTSRINAFCDIEGASIGKGAIIGPFARIRPGSEVADDVHIGNFVELKATTMRRGAKANHLAYLGDSEIGAASNIGAGTIFVNYDGYGKHRTVVGDDVFIGSNSSLVAPVTHRQGRQRHRRQRDHRGRAGRRPGIRPRPPGDKEGARRPASCETPGQGCRCQAAEGKEVESRVAGVVGECAASSESSARRRSRPCWSMR